MMVAYVTSHFGFFFKICDFDIKFFVFCLPCQTEYMHNIPTVLLTVSNGWMALAWWWLILDCVCMSFEHLSNVNIIFLKPVRAISVSMIHHTTFIIEWMKGRKQQQNTKILFLFQNKFLNLLNTVILVLEQNRYWCCFYTRLQEIILVSFSS